MVNEHFRVIDELGDCRRLFARLTETLGASWETMYAMAQEYFTKHQNLEVPATYMTPEGYSLGAWIATQRKVRAGKAAGHLDGDRIARLDGLGMRWQSVKEAAWERNYAEARKYYGEHGNLSVPKRYVAGSGKNLGNWLQRQRAAHKNGQLNEWQIGMLDQIGMVWEAEEPWNVGYLHAKEYFWGNGNLEVPNGYVCEDGYRLGKWISNQRSAYGGRRRRREDTKEKIVERTGNGQDEERKKIGINLDGKGLTEGQIQRLEEIGMIWNAKLGRPVQEGQQ